VTARSAVILAKYYREQANNFERAAVRTGINTKAGKDFLRKASFMRERGRQ
jgi:hypothetical protein